MIETLQVEAFLNARDNGPGVTKPSIILADDGNKYFLKGNLGKFGEQLISLDASLAQEAICYKLAKILNVPTPAFVFIEITDEDLSDFPDLRFSTNIVKPGIYLGVRSVDNLLTQELNLILNELNFKVPGAKRRLNNLASQISNKSDIPKIVYFDFLTANVDRYQNPGNILLHRSNNGKIVLSIDFGYCFFGPYWKSRDYIAGFKKVDLLQKRNFSDNSWLTFLISALGKNRDLKETLLFKLFDPLIDCKSSANPFNDIYCSTKLLTPSTLTTMINSIPTSWFTEGDYQKNLYLQFLLNQVNTLPNIFDYLVSRNYFTNISGGGLFWGDKNILSQ